MEMFDNNKKTTINVLKGIVVAFVFTVIALIIFSSILVYTNLSEDTIKPVIITVTGISILVGSSMGTRKIKKNGALNGAIIGVAYILIIYLISSMINTNFNLNLISLIMMAVGIIGGIIGRHNWCKYVKYKV